MDAAPSHSSAHFQQVVEKNRENWEIMGKLYDTYFPGPVKNRAVSESLRAAVTVTKSDTKPVTKWPSRKSGRPRKHESGAARSKAYRERKSGG